MTRGIGRTFFLLFLLFVGGPAVVPVIEHVGLHVLPLVVIALALSFVKLSR